jgi:hypothetical protein
MQALRAGCLELQGECLLSKTHIPAPGASRPSYTCSAVAGELQPLLAERSHLTQQVESLQLQIQQVRRARVLGLPLFLCGFQLCACPAL